MTLSYWWMHWFWITFRIYFGVSEEITLSHSIIPVTASPELDHRPAKALGVSVSNPPIHDSPSNTTASVAKQKPSSKKFEVYSNMMKQNTTEKSYSPSKEVTVINQNTTDVSNITDNQIMLNSNFSAINHTDSFNYVNETNFNQSLLLSSEKNVEKDEELSGNLSAAGITGITLGSVIIVGVICGVSYLLYRNRGFNRPQVLNDRCSNPDSSGYIDDASVRDNSEEMYSLDNDSFLNSLEAMTIQNYWTDTVKHTKL
ncbi:hypothetical protein Zmor_003000 [Zophobas morio]|uniref:Uncharacterized protein n=1 Tax=Zophobas morio TaxID=2755281 RepID=A0AA38HKU7_9CUCU|nr:hypothetical protein Zmor_003000 [Zophobas morio]